MSVHIGNNNKIKNSNIAEKINIDSSENQNRTFYNRHPIMCGFLISLIAGLVLLFSFWTNVITWIEGWF